MSRNIKTTVKSSQSQQLADLMQLTKFRLSVTVVFSSVLAYLAAADQLSWVRITLLTLGGMLVTCAGGVLNQVLERDTDKLMTRTSGRPLAAGRMANSTAVLMAGLMSALGISMLSLLGPVTAFLGTISLLIYSFIYTPLKKHGHLAVTIGAIPGALPTMIGAVAAQGDRVTWLSLLLFSIQFLWQFPHFWSIAWLADEDYKRAGFRLLPGSGNKDASVGLYSVLYCCLLAVVVTIPYIMGYVQLPVYLGVQLANMIYLYQGWLLHRTLSNTAARRLMFASFLYLPVVLTLFMFNRF